MSDDQLFPINETNEGTPDQIEAEAPLEEEEFEEITSDEVDRVVQALEDLAETTQSLNIKAYLEEAAANIYCLVYDEEDLEEAA